VEDEAVAQTQPLSERFSVQCDQAEVVAFLADPASYPGADRVERFETHGNLVFLAGSEAWKIKRAVRFPYMDFSTLEKRHAACLREVEINRQFASALYLGCVPIARSPAGNLAFGSVGSIVEWAVHMRRFEQAALLSSITAEGQVSLPVKTRSAKGAQAALSHTGTLAGADDAYEAAFRRAGVLRVRDSTSFSSRSARSEGCISVLSVRRIRGFIGTLSRRSHRTTFD
jgi:hypothetical protein